jgi:hypothetical protein
MDRAGAAISAAYRRYEAIILVWERQELRDKTLKLGKAAAVSRLVLL